MSNGVYVFGPISNLPDGNIAAFRAAESFLLEMGYQPIIPHDIVGNAVQNFTWQECMWMDIAAVAGAQPVAFAGLPGWRASRGAKAEFMWALSIDLPVWVLRASYDATNPGFRAATDIATGRRVPRYRLSDLTRRESLSVSPTTDPGELTPAQAKLWLGQPGETGGA